MVAIQTFDGRRFIQPDYYRTLDRRIVHQSSKTWIYTVDEVLDEDGNTYVRILTWAARNDKKDKNIKYWKIRSSYNVRHSSMWDVASSQVDAMLRGDLDDGNSIILSKEKYENLIKKGDKIPELKDKINDLKNFKSAAVAEIYSFKKKLNLMKKNVKEYENSLKEFKKLVDSDNSTETDVHKFIIEKDMFWVFGLEYVNMEKEVGFPPEKPTLWFDIMLQRHDSFWDLVELKGPNENLFDRRTKARSKPNQKLAEAISQVITYLHLCDSLKEKSILKPNAIIVIGKEETDKIEDRKLLSSHLNDIEIITYYDLYNKGKNLIDYIKTATVSKTPKIASKMTGKFKSSGRIKTKKEI